MDLTTIQSPAETSSTTLMILGIAFIAIAGCIIFGNSLILISIRRFRKLRTLTNGFVFSLACADLCAGITILWQSVFNFKPEMDLVGPLCLSRFIQIAPSYCSLLHLVVIATDRYLAILHPLRYHDFMTPRVANVLIGVTWTMAIILTAVIIGTSRFIAGVTLCMMADVTPQLVMMVVFHIFFGIWLSILMFLYGSIFIAAKRQITQIQALEVTNKVENKKGSNMAKELKAARQLAFIVLVFLVTHTPGYIVVLLGYFYDKYMSAEKYLVYYKLGILIMFFNSFMNPIVYAMKNREFREAFKIILCKRMVREGQREDSLGLDDSNTAGQPNRTDLNTVSRTVKTSIGVANAMQLNE